jgi:hypothetical protein
LAANVIPGYWRNIEGNEPDVLNDLAQNIVSELVSLGCRVSYQRSERAGGDVISIYEPLNLLISDEFDVAMRAGRFVLQSLLCPDIEIPYENPQWLKLTKAKAVSHKGQVLHKDVYRHPRGIEFEAIVCFLRCGGR